MQTYVYNIQKKDKKKTKETRVFKTSENQIRQKNYKKTQGQGQKKTRSLIYACKGKQVNKKERF